MTTAFNFSTTSSGLDVSSIVDNLITARSAPITYAQNRQKAYNSQISEMGKLTSALSSLGTAISTIKTSGTLGVSQSGTTTGLTATAGSSAVAGRYAVSVDALAQAAKARTTGAFTSGSDAVKAGTLNLSINGASTDVEITEGMTLSQVADAINASGAAATASVLSSNGTAFLSITNKNTGFTVGGQPADALTITETSTGATGTALGLSTVTPAKNAKVTIDGLQFERQSNSIDDALPGVSLELTAEGSPQDLVLANDPTATEKNLQSFVDAYNGVMKILQSNLNIAQATDRNYTLAGDTSVRALQQQMMGIISTVGGTSATVRTLADLGIKTGEDGTLSIDSARLGKAIATDANAVNGVFQNATSGIADRFSSLVSDYTNATDGIFTLRNKSMNDSVKDLDTQITSLQARLDSYRNQLIAQYTAMETTVSGFKSLGSYLTAQSDAAKNSNA